MRRYELNDECRVPPDQSVMRETDGSCGDWVRYEDAKAEIDRVAEPQIRECVLQAQLKAASKEKSRRCYYQNIVYNVCSQLDAVTGRHISKGSGIVCGTFEQPSTEVQDTLAAVLRRADGKELAALRAECDRLKAEVADNEELLNGDVPYEPCTKCKTGLLFSARAVGDGLCHACGHKELAAVRKECENLQVATDVATKQYDVLTARYNHESHSWHETRKRLEGELKATQTERDSLANRVKELESEHRTPSVPIGDDWRDYRLRADHAIMVKARRDQYDMIWIAAEDGPWTMEGCLFDLLFAMDVPCAAPAASTPTGPADNDRQDEPRTPAAPHERTVRVFTGRKEQH